MRDVTAIVARTTQSHLGIHVSSVHIHLHVCAGGRWVKYVGANIHNDSGSLIIVVTPTVAVIKRCPANTGCETHTIKIFGGCIVEGGLFVRGPQ